VRERVKRALEGQLGKLTDALDGLTPGRSWQSGHTLHENPEQAELVKAINALADNVLRFLHVGHDGFEITGCWANVNALGARHHTHHHPNNFLSGVYYVRAPNGADTINFHEPRPQTRVLRPPVTALGSQNTDLVTLRVASGTLLMFPSWLEHSVPPSESQELRISVSYNLMFSRYAETMSRPMWDGGDR
jgi:uncharacterized protein (TIGR02466 family)